MSRSITQRGDLRSVTRKGEHRRVRGDRCGRERPTSEPAPSFWRTILSDGHRWSPSHPDTDRILASLTDDEATYFVLALLSRGVHENRVKSIMRRRARLRDPSQMRGDWKYDRQDASDPWQHGIGGHMPDSSRGGGSGA